MWQGNTLQNPKYSRINLQDQSESRWESLIFHGSILACIVQGCRDNLFFRQGTHLLHGTDKLFPVLYCKSSQIPVLKGNARLVDAINQALEDMRASGELAALSERYFGADVTSE